MNLLFVGVWCVIIVQFTICVPRQRRSRIKYKTKNMLNPGIDTKTPIALQVLEHKFLHSGNLDFRNYSTEKKPAIHCSRNKFQNKKYISLDNKNDGIDDEVALPLDSCSASFGPHSPLCMTRQQIKNHVKRSPQNHLYVEPITLPGESASTVEDFFGLFSSNATQNTKTSTTQITNSQTEDSVNAVVITDSNSFITFFNSLKSKIEVCTKGNEIYETSTVMSTSGRNEDTINTNLSGIFKPLVLVNSSKSTVEGFRLFSTAAPEVSESTTIQTNKAEHVEHNISSVVNETPNSVINLLNSAKSRHNESFVSQNNMKTDGCKFPRELDNSRSHTRQVLLPGNLAKLQATSKLLIDDSDDISNFFSADEDESGGNLNVDNSPEERPNETTVEFGEQVTVNTEENGRDALHSETSDENGNRNDHLESGPEEEPKEEKGNHDDENTTSESLKYPENDHGPSIGSEDQASSDIARKKCEMGDRNRKCVCSIKSLKSDFESIFSVSKSSKDVLEEAKELRCKDYIPLPVTFDISPHSRPTQQDKDKKPVAVDEEKGPKEIDQTSINGFISQSGPSDEDNVVRVFGGKDVKVPCFPSKNIHLPASDADDVKYKWMHQNSKPISEGNMKEDSDGEGSLSIENIEPVDSDNYTCKVEYINPDTGHRKQESFEHRVIVVTLPIVSVHVAMHYRAPDRCDNSVRDMFKLYVPSLLQAAICGLSESNSRALCRVEVHNAVCVDARGHANEKSKRESKFNSTSGLGDSSRTKREVTKDISLNYEVYTAMGELRSMVGPNAKLCDVNCHLVIALKLLQLFKASMHQAVRVPVNSNTENASGTFDPVSSLIRMKYILGCVGGNYYEGDGLCVACPKHTYSAEGAVVCSPCPRGTYMGNMGASQCNPCSRSWVPACNEYIEDDNVFMFFILIIAAMTLVVIIIVWYFVSTKKSKLQDVSRLFMERDMKTLMMKSPLTSSAHKPKLAKTQMAEKRRKNLAHARSEELETLISESPGTTAMEDSEGDQTPRTDKQRKGALKKVAPAVRRKLF